MVHHRQSLPFSLEPGDYLPGIHAGLKDFQGHTALEGFGLFGHVNHSAAAFADLLEQAESADVFAGVFQGGRGSRREFRKPRNRRAVQQFPSALQGPKQAFDTRPQGRISGALLVQVRGAFRALKLPRRLKNGFFTWVGFTHVPVYPFLSTW
jgi:hypothetical protein